MRWIDLHVLVILLMALIVTFLAAGFGKAPVHWLLLGAGLFVQFPLWTKVLDFRRGKHSALAYVAANEALILVLCSLCWLAVWLVRGS